MIALLQGKVIKKDSDSLVLLNSGVGYKIFSTEAELNNVKLEEDTQLWIHENIKEDRHDLFGFKEVAELELFEKLLSVNGAGPKAALAVLNIGSVSDLKTALINSDAKYIQQASGVGKKLAERLILELSGRLSDTALDNSLSNRKQDEDDEAYQALVSLGYAPKDAAKALERVDQSLSTEDRIKQALRG